MLDMFKKKLTFRGGGVVMADAMWPLGGAAVYLVDHPPPLMALSIQTTSLRNRKSRVTHLPATPTCPTH